MAKRRKRKANLGSAVKHRADATRLYQYAKDAQLDAKDAKTCPKALRSLAEAQNYAGQADLSISSVGHVGGESRAAISLLRRQLAKEFDDTLKNCVKAGRRLGVQNGY